MTEHESTPLPPAAVPKRTGRRFGALQPFALDSRRAREESRPDPERLSLLVATQQAIAVADLDLHALVHLIVERVQQLTGASGAAIALTEGDHLVYRAASGAASDDAAELGEPAEGFPLDRMWRCDQPWIAPAEEPTRPGAACAALLLPLHHHERLVGVLEVLSPLAHAFDDREIHTFQLLQGLLAAVLSHARDYEQKVIQLAQRTLALHESEARFESAFTFSTFGMARVTPDGGFLQVNPALCALFGCPPEEFSGLDLHGLTHPEDLALHLVYLERLLLGELRNYQLEQRFRTRDGRTMHALLSVSLSRDFKGGPGTLLVQFQDLTAQKRLQDRCEELRRLASFARLIGELPPELRRDGPSPGTQPRHGIDENRFGEEEIAGAVEARPPREWSFDGWYYPRGGVVIGPVSRDTLRQLVEAGAVQPVERVWERWKQGVESFMVPTSARAACVR